MKNLLLACVTLIVLTALFAFQEGVRLTEPSRDEYDLTGHVTRVVDGDTFYLGEDKIRIWGIVTPDRKQEGYQEATEALTHLIHNQSVSCKRKDIDKWKRIVAQCFFEGQDIGGIMVDLGHARDFVRYSKGYYTR